MTTWIVLATCYSNLPTYIAGFTSVVSVVALSLRNKCPSGRHRDNLSPGHILLSVALINLGAFYSTRPWRILVAASAAASTCSPTTGSTDHYHSHLLRLSLIPAYIHRQSRGPTFFRVLDASPYLRYKSSRDEGSHSLSYNSLPQRVFSPRRLSSTVVLVIPAQVSTVYLHP